MSLVRLQDVLLGRYAPGDSALHRADPRMKLAAAAVLGAAVFAAADWRGYALLALYVAAAARLAQVPAPLLWRGVRPLVPLIALAAAMHLLFTPGHLLWRLGPVRVSQEGLVAAGQMTARLLLLLTGVSLVTLTTTPLALSRALERLLAPFQRLGLPAADVAMMMTIALRFIPTLGDELDKIVKAQKARGADLDSGGVVERARQLLPLLVPLFAGALRRAEELGLAMEARGYRVGQRRTSMHETAIRLADWLGLTVTAAWCAAAVWFGAR